MAATAYSSHVGSRSQFNPYLFKRNGALRIACSGKDTKSATSVTENHPPVAPQLMASMKTKLPMSRTCHLGMGTASILSADGSGLHDEVSRTLAPVKLWSNMNNKLDTSDNAFLQQTCGQVMQINHDFCHGNFLTFYHEFAIFNSQIIYTVVVIQ